MYLVLVAMLALNVSKEIIKAFNLMENSLDNSSRGIMAKNVTIHQSIDQKARDGNVNAKAALMHYQKASEISEKLIARIKTIKKDLEKRTEGRIAGADGELVKGGLNELIAADNMEIHANYFTVENGGTRGADLQKLINQTRKDLLQVLDNAIADPVLSSDVHTRRFLTSKRKEIGEKSFLSAEDNVNSEGKQNSWVNMYLENVPLAGVFALLSKVENDVRYMQEEVAQTLAESVGAKTIEVDTVEPVIRAPASALIVGQPYEADIMLAAYDSRSNMAMTVNGAPIDVEGGMGKFRVNTSTPGEYTFEVGINVPTPEGGFKVKKQTGKYSVFAPSAAISADELNVLYAGLDNPLSISVAGVDPGKVQVTVPGGEVQLVNRGGGKYFARFRNRTTNECIVSVSAMVGNRMMFMGTKKFRLRNVPSPRFQIGPHTFNNPIKISEIVIHNLASAVIDGFVYNGVSYSVSRFKFTYVSRTKGFFEKNYSGNSLAEVMQKIRNLKAGDVIMFTEIFAIGPEGNARPIQSVVATLL